jgi:hypothetical protein
MKTDNLNKAMKTREKNKKAEGLILGWLLMIVSIVVFVMIVMSPDLADAWPTKYSSCTGCHGTVDATANIHVAINGTETTSVIVAPNGSFEVDYHFTDVTNSSGYGVGLQVIVPIGWTIGHGVGQCCRTGNVVCAV